MPQPETRRTIVTWPPRGRGSVLLRGIGWAVLGLSLAFLASQLWRTGAAALIAQHWRSLILAVALGTLVYAAAGVLLAEAWRQLLGGAGAGPWLDHLVVHGRTQIAKYLPGNCFHFAGRQWLGRRLGHGQATLAMASLAETLLLIGVALGLSLLLPGRGLLPPWLPAALGCAAAALTVAGLVWWRRRSARAAVAGRSLVQAGDLARRLASAASLHLVFFLACGAIVWLLACAIAGPMPLPLAPLRALGAFALAWVAGVVVPGAAAGIGVREAALTLALQGVVGGEASAVLALALRVVTSLGDGVLFATCLALPSPTAVDRPPTGADFSDRTAIITTNR